MINGDEIRKAFHACIRASELARSMDQSRRTGDLGQAVAGVAAELRTALRALSPQVAELDALAAEAVADTAGKVRNDAPATSRAAAAAVVRSGSQRARVLLHLSDRGPHTDLELQEHLVLAASSERPRRGELVDLGLVQPTDGVRSHGGRDWTVWSLTRLGEGVVTKLRSGDRTVQVAAIQPPPPSTVDTVAVPEMLF
jgi:hypothetical protein